MAKNISNNTNSVVVGESNYATINNTPKICDCNVSMDGDIYFYGEGLDDLFNMGDERAASMLMKKFEISCKPEEIETCFVKSENSKTKKLKVKFIKKTKHVEI